MGANKKAASPRGTIMAKLTLFTRLVLAAASCKTRWRKRAAPCRG